MYTSNTSDGKTEREKIKGGREKISRGQIAHVSMILEVLEGKELLTYPMYYLGVMAV